MQKLVRITTVPISLEKLLEGQLTFMNKYYEVTAISADKERLVEYGKNNNVRIYHVELTRSITPVKDLKALFRLFKYFKREKPAIVHTHTPKAGIIGMVAAKMAGVPIRIHTVAGMPLLETAGIKRRILNLVEKLTYSLATRIYPNSRGLQEIILKERFALPSKLKVLGNGSSNGIDTKYFDPSLFSEEYKRELKKKLKIPFNNIVFIFVGRLVSEKGLNELVSAFVSLNNDFSNISLLLVGNYEPELDPLSQETLEIINNHPGIISVGYQDDVRPYFAISHILAFPSYREGFPNVVMQAGSMGLPSIVSDINGCNEIIENGKNGVIIPVKNEEFLYRAMKSLKTDEGMRKRLSALARDRILSEYDRPEFWKILKKEYELLEKELSKVNRKII